MEGGLHGRELLWLPPSRRMTRAKEWKICRYETHSAKSSALPTVNIQAVE